MIAHTKPLVIASLLAALAVDSAFGSHEWARLPTVMLLSGVVVFFAAGKLPEIVVPLVFGTVFISPLLFTIALGRFRLFYWLVPAAALLGVIFRISPAREWRLPNPFGWSIALWGLIVACSWPIVALREVDFTPALLYQANLYNTGGGLKPGLVIEWTAGVAVAQLVPLLWLDALYVFAPGGTGPKWRRINRALAIAVALGAIVSTYQAFVDPAFLSAGQWPTLRRAAGPLLDANVSGMLLACLGPVLAWEFVAAERLWLGVALLVLSELAVWGSGSRSSAAAGGIVGLTVLLRIAGARVAVLRFSRLIPALVLVIGAVAALVWFAPWSTVSPLSRARLPTEWSWRGFSGYFVQELWNRNLYGILGVHLIKEFPWAGVGIGSFHIVTSDLAAELFHIVLPADNAQNWFRHQLAEFGILGSVGWVTWSAAVIWRLIVQSPQVRGRALVVDVAIVTFGLASLVGMPGQNLAAALMICTLCSQIIPVSDGGRPSRTPAWMTAVGLLLVSCYICATLYTAMHDLRPAFRAARFDYDYAYGFQIDSPDLTWTDRHAVIVPQAAKPWLKLTYWIEHPDAATRPVRVEIWRDHDRIVDRKLWNDVRVTEYVPVPGNGKRFVLEVKVDRTFRPSDYGASDAREHGLNLKWESVDSTPPGER